MVTAEIAYDQLLSSAPEIIDAAAALLDEHPDRGAFEVAGSRATGRDHARRALLECARWPDDARKTAYDHAYWHVTAWPVVSSESPPASPPDLNTPAFEAIPAFDLNFKTLKDKAASIPERAVALCWVMHLAGDVHQPLHTAQLFSARAPNGDRMGLDEYVQDATGKPVTLHWYWDDSVNQSNDDQEIVRRARELQDRFPRGSLTELQTPTHAGDFGRWARQESYPLAVKYVYGPGLSYGSTAAEARAVPEDQAKQVASVAQRRATIAGYRIADLLRDALGK
jgi:hypothetical protein